jgi:hypothetical protein
VFGVISDFRDRIYPGATLAKPSAGGAFNNSAIGGGAGVNARWTFAKKYDVGIHFMGGSGTGRYGTSQLADLVARPDGVLTPVTNYQALGTLEYHVKKLDVYANYGAEYEDRVQYLNAAGKPVGYGSTLFNNSGCNTETVPASTSTTVVTGVTQDPGTGVVTVTTGTVPAPGSLGTPLTGGYNPGGLKNCNGDTRFIMEGTIGSGKFTTDRGRLGDYAMPYIDRNIWRAAGIRTRRRTCSSRRSVITCRRSLRKVLLGLTYAGAGTRHLAPVFAFTGDCRVVQGTATPNREGVLY